MPGTLLSIIHIPSHLTSYQSYEGGLIIIPAVELRELKKLKVKTRRDLITCSMLLGFRVERQQLILGKRGLTLFYSLHLRGGQRRDRL